MSEQHLRTCPAYGNYQPPDEECTCGLEERDSQRRQPTTSDLRTDLVAQLRALVEDMRVYEDSGCYGTNIKQWVRRLDVLIGSRPQAPETKPLGSRIVLTLMRCSISSSPGSLTSRSGPSSVVLLLFSV